MNELTREEKKNLRSGFIILVCIFLVGILIGRCSYDDFYESDTDVCTCVCKVTGNICESENNVDDVDQWE